MSKAARKTPEQRKAEAEALRSTLVAQAEALRESGEWRRFLTSAAALQTFSARNIMLILAQRESASDVAGFRQWIERGRAVRKGEKSIKIMAPSSRKTGRTVVDETGAETDEKITVFRVVSVFDVAQTDPIDGPAETPQPVAGAITAASEPAQLWARVAAVLQGKGWDVRRVGPQQLEGADGMTRYGSRRIEVDERLEDAHAVLVLLHEAGHALLHNHAKTQREYEDHRSAREVSAESVAYIMATLLGIDAADNSAVYCAAWMREMSAEDVQETAAGVLQAVRELTEALQLDTAAEAA